MSQKTSQHPKNCRPLLLQLRLEYTRTMADFRTLTKTMKQYIKVQHHLSQIIPGGEVPVKFLQIERKLIRTICPAGPTPKTDHLLTGNAKNWTHSIMQILHKHYTLMSKKCEAELKTVPKDSWERALAVARRWVKRDFRSLNKQTLQAATQKIQEIMTCPKEITRATQTACAKCIKPEVEEQPLNINVKVEERPVNINVNAEKQPVNRNVKVEEQPVSINVNMKEQPVNTVKGRPKHKRKNNQ
ncbi:uncharacterized protein LOC133478075 isoform X2 [Phyllopteryx taeniolatus]|uniref:uncharacterized protein LOC133478075 isoform X2 n=1 Tax=Phyllopteryx taeniolatus TaxID=161469 RepID=UPI002AD564BD|nr:uncharacterized protein LOC133478075 isoform X2 [Phyllopteryx taeniolatus]